MPIKLPIIIDMSYNEDTKKVFKTIETLLKIEVIGTIKDNSSMITEDNITNYYKDTEQGIEIQALQTSIYRDIVIKGYYK